MTEGKFSLHKPVLLNEAISGLNFSGDGSGAIALDATFGGGGHSREILERFSKAEVIALDRDGSVWREDMWKKYKGRISFFCKDFRNLDEVLDGQKMNGIIFDLGISSDQLGPPSGGSGRGFSFMRDEPLLMTMKENPGPEDLTAREIVNGWSEENLAKIIYGYGEEKFAGRIAKEIAKERSIREIQSTFGLVRIIERAVPGRYKRGRIHFATRTFQALRIAVNDELGALVQGLKKGLEFLAGASEGKAGGRMVVITFHSIEDRIVKNFFREAAKEGRATILNKKPIVPNAGEMKENPRSRSAKLRVLEKI